MANYLGFDFAKEANYSAANMQKNKKTRDVYHVRAALIRNVARREQHLSYLQLVTARARAPIGRDVT